MIDKLILSNICTVADRAEDVSILNDLTIFDRSTLIVNLIHVAHLMDFDKLLKFDDVNFMHDINGVLRYVMCTTYEFSNCFSPRCEK